MCTQWDYSGVQDFSEKEGEEQDVGFGAGSYNLETGKCCLKNQHSIQKAMCIF